MDRGRFEDASVSVAYSECIGNVTTSRLASNPLSFVPFLSYPYMRVHLRPFVVLEYHYRCNTTRLKFKFRVLEIDLQANPIPSDFEAVQYSGLPTVFNTSIASQQSGGILDGKFQPWSGF